LALARLDAEWPGELLIVTQNVDDLHERAGAKRLTAHAWRAEIRLVSRLRCAGSLGRGSFGRAPCPACGRAGSLRPDIVWFGECRTTWSGSTARSWTPDLFVSIGTSGAVYPAAGFVQTARYCGARTLEMNLDPSLGSIYFHEARTGAASALFRTGWMSCSPLRRARLDPPRGTRKHRRWRATQDRRAACR
jgi:NAD-dependent deacetylase